jgi:hypothetical protein
MLNLIPGGWGSVIWLILMSYLGLTALFYVTLGTRGWAGLLVLLLAYSIAMVLGLANVDNLLLAAIILCWSVRDRPRVLGILVGALVCLKLTPAVLLVWLIATHRTRALAWAIGSIGALMVATEISTEPGIWARYARVLVDGAAIGRPWALGILVIGFAFVVAFGRRRPGLAFSISVALIPFGSPQATDHTWAMLIAALAPLVTEFQTRRVDARVAEVRSIIRSWIERPRGSLER